MSKAICNASPIIALAMLNQLKLLWTLFEEVYVPEAVYKEIVLGESVNNYGQTELREAIDQGCVSVYTVKDQALVGNLYGKLHRGEIETVVGGREMGVDFVVLDEKAARVLAQAFLLVPIGTIGILRLAKTQGLIDSVRPYLDFLRVSGFRISDYLYRKILESELEGQ
ncbi:MAG: DUF3368 domain-containing protein [Firmicutes bacterium]|nr:DUF3368 domain-containing protein [Bacillota bacterium]